MIKPVPFLLKITFACLALLLFCAMPAVSQKRPVKKSTHIKKVTRTLKPTSVVIKKKVLAAPRRIIVHDVADTVITSPDGSFAICSGSNIQLYANNVKDYNTIKWYKDNVEIPGENSQYYYATEAGSYRATSGGFNYKAVVVTVNPLPVANFTFTGDNQCASVPVKFNGSSSTGSNITYSWDFGDSNSGKNNTSTSKTPIHKFVGYPGESTQQFYVQLTVTTDKGCSNTYGAYVTTQQPTDVTLGGPSPIVYNGDNYFRGCGAVPTTMTFTNISSTKNINQSYIISWGDGSPNFTSTSFKSTTHLYAIGTYKLNYIIVNTSGCRDTAFYKVFVGSNPAVGLNNPGNTAICTNSLLTFPVTGTDNNPPGTTYTITFNDGSAPVVTDIAPKILSHLFTISSCGTYSGTYSDSFSATIVASNPCSSSSAVVSPIYVSQKPVVDYDASLDKVCVNGYINFNNKSLANDVSNAGCVQGNVVWSITPATGWTANGSMGDDLGVTDQTLWAPGDQYLQVQFTKPGTYKVKLKTGSTNCGLDSLTKTICVNPTPTAAFNTDVAKGCGPLTVKTTNTSPAPNCGTNTYRWSVSPSFGYTYTGGTTETSVSPQFIFSNSRDYTISLVTISPGGDCESEPVSHTISVNTKPTFTLNASAILCEGNDFQPNVTAVTGTANTYAWTFEGGMPATSNSQFPGTVTYNKAGSYTTTLVVTNACGITTTTAPVTVKPTPVAKLPANQFFCGGMPTNVLQLSSNVPGTTFRWQNDNTSIGLKSSANGDIPVFTAVNNTGFPITATITVTPSNNGCTGLPVAFTITVNPKPEAPQTLTPLSYCKNESTAPLSATPSNNNTLNWYTDAQLQHKLAGAPVPSTTSTGTTNYYVTQSNSYGCESDAAVINVIVNPGIDGNTITKDQTVCYDTSPTALTSSATPTGGSSSYNYQWELSTNGTDWSPIVGAVSSSYSPGNLKNTTQYRRQITSGGCSNTSNVITITVQGVLGNYDISASQSTCTNNTPASLTGQVPTGGNGTFGYQWEVSTNNIDWSAINGATAVNYQPGALGSTTYYRRFTKSGTCSGYSSVVIITIIPPPVVNPVTSVIYCKGSNTAAINFSTAAAGTITYNWVNDNPLTGLATSGTGPVPQFLTANASHQPITSNISVTAAVANGASSCPGPATKFAITVLPLINLQAIQNQNSCSGLQVPAFTPASNAASFAGASVTYSWTVSNASIGLQNGSGSQIPGFTAINNGTTEQLSTVTVTPVYNYGGSSCEGTPVSYTISVKAQPTANAGSDAVLCNQPAYQLSGNKPEPGFTGTWTEVNGNLVTFSPDLHTYNATVTGLQPGVNYAFKWTITNNACGITSATVSVKNLKPLTNTISTAEPTLCLGVPANITGTTPTGGDGQYQYSWQSSNDNQNWNSLNGETGKDLTINLTATTYIRRIVASATCSLASNALLITVKAAITNNSVGGPGSVCTGFSAGKLTGSPPTGGDGNFAYQWQSSTDNANWQPITQAIQADYITPVLTQDTYYRRLVSSALCQGAQQSISNAIKIAVNPNAKADFTATTTTGCAPFDLRQVIKAVLYDDRNATYEWFANGVSIGKNSDFPTYSINQDGQTVLIKLVTTSKSGCDTNSKQLNFSTIKSVVASFTKDQAKACGPLIVNFKNISLPIGAATYSWNFGNGQTSTQIQPNPVTYLPHPLNKDTTYVITLTATTGCGINVYRDSVTVRPKPKAIFTPDKTIGCSPFEMTITNQSRGVPNTYTFDFGDGNKIVKNTNDPFKYTYKTDKTDTLTLKMTAENECGVDSTSYRIVVYPNNVKVNLVVNGDNQFGCAPVAVKFFNNTTSANNFTWDFGDGNIATTKSAPETMEHTYAKAGIYVVKLTASNGCSTSSDTRTITIYDQPSAAFTYSQSQYCVNAPVAFNNTSAQNGYSYVWDFKDGTTSNDASPTHQFGQPGRYNVTLTITHSYPNGSACKSTVSHDLQIITAPDAGFTTNAQLLNCVPFTLTTHATPANATGVDWDFGDPTSADNTGSGYTLTHAYAKAGVYTVRLIAYNQNSCADTSYQVVRVTEKPYASFTPGDSVLCGATTTIKFANTSTYTGGDLVAYKWLINGTVVSAQKNLSYAFTPPANAKFPYLYTIKLIAASTIGCQDTVTHTIQFNALPKAGYTVQVNTSCIPFLVSVTNTSVYADQYKWYLDNKLISTDLVPAQLLLTEPAKSYKLKLVVGNQFGCKTDSIEKTIGTYAQPKALFTLRDSSSCNGVLDLKMTNQSAGASSYSWDFGDGSQGSALKTPTHVYGIPGFYTLQLIVSNGFCKDTASQIIRVSAPPKAAFIAGTLKGCALLTTTFQNISTNADTYLWDFGDGTFSAGKNPTHTYNYLHSPYTVRLIAYGTNGCADTTVQPKYISVTAPPVANFKVLPDSVIKIPDYGFSFTNTSTGSPVKYAWDFGDGKVSDTENPSHTYLDTGIYAVRLIVTNSDDCTDTLVRHVQVSGVPGYLFVPNAFEPGSGKSELQTFTVRASGLSAYSLRIFNKWGEMIFETTKLIDSVPAEGWNGMMHGQPAPQGVYVWLISARFINGTEWKGMKYKTGTATKTGPVHLIR